MKELDAARMSLETKIEGLMLMRPLIASEHFARTVTSIEQAGRCVITGMGKSGIVARKIAGTFQSIAQRAVFLDPAAAGHGDMGIIEAGDVVLMVSNSGETDELRAVASYAFSQFNEIILITSQSDSSLAKIACHILKIPSVPEGDPIGRVPMSSIVCQLAIGDMLAAALMARRNVTEAQFLALHHSGYLGRRIKAVA